mgnify:CR=1 FL=1
MKNSILIFILALSISSCKSEKLELKSYLNHFEKTNSYILKNSDKEMNLTELILEKKINEFPFLIEIIQKSKLCAINYYPKKGIVYKFKCENNSSDNFFDSNDKLYLIKILDKRNELLNYEQYLDYSKKPIKLKNNWYLIQQNITND